jgi:hypothetical protein
MPESLNFRKNPRHQVGQGFWELEQGLNGKKIAILSYPSQTKTGFPWWYRFQ